MRLDFSFNTVIYDTANKNKTIAKSRFELGTVQSSPRFPDITKRTQVFKPQFPGFLHDACSVLAVCSGAVE